MICDVKAQLLDNPYIFDDANLVNEDEIGQNYCQLEIISQNNYFVLRLITGIEIGALNTNISHCFQELSETASVRYEFFINVDVLREAIQAWKQTGKRGILPIDINVYGSRDATGVVGRVFSRARLYFQHPYRFDGSAEYDNPHYLSFSNIVNPESLILSPWNISVYQAKRSSNYNISKVLENLDQQEYVRQVDIDSRVRTPLLNHQKEGVDFITQREAGVVPSPLSLWEITQQTSTRSFYKHLITGSKRQIIPDNNLGGIVSDEMGMGKSLTMLSAIVASLATAESFAQSEGRDLVFNGVRKPASKATLVVIPSALLLDTWIEEVKKHILPNTLNTHKYHGPRKELDPLKLLNFDIVFTTYATVATEFRRGSNILHNINWFRIVLDEAHEIRHQNTLQFRAVSTMSSKIRWCLSGTPIQNSLKDLEALVKFLRVPLLETASIFRKYIISPIELGSSCGFHRLRLLLRSLCLRRTNKILQLSEPITRLYQLNLTGAEDAAYASIGETYRQEIDRAVSGRKTAEAYNGILQALLRLRLLCNHGTYEQLPQKIGSVLPSDPEEALEFLQQSDGASCAYCSCDVTVVGKPNDPQSAQLTVCSHLLCSECLPQYESDLKETIIGKKAQCPLCDNMIVGNFIAMNEKMGPKNAPVWATPPGSLTPFGLNGGYSTKLSTLLQDVESQEESEKSIIFSAWKKSLDFLAFLLEAKAIPFATIDGSISLPERRKVLSNFKSNPNIKTLLMTFGTGAVGLNLSIANRVHILEPQWNPSIEKQAIGRILRLGQERQITVIRYIMNGTVEEYIVSRQLRKLQLATIGWEEEEDNEEEQKLKELLELRSVILRNVQATPEEVRQ
ncbi:SNF2 family N-terminal domain-containing protein [Tricladium varicosporioides]|nr:SNF2 family N-terminal domain-containing protein [Hymenoscyphus varicosporioides]